MGEFFSVLTSSMSYRIDEEGEIARKLSSYAQQIDDVQAGLLVRNTTLALQVGAALRSNSSSLRDAGKDAEKLQSSLKNVRFKYLSTEALIANGLSPISILLSELEEGWTHISQSILPGLGGVSSLATTTSALTQHEWFKVTPWSTKDEEKLSTKLWKDESGRTYKDGSGKYTWDTDPNDPTKKKWVKQPDGDSSDKKGTAILNDITIYGDKISGSAQVYNWSMGDDKNGMNIDVLKVEGSAGYAITGGGIKGEAGVSVDVFKFTEQAQLLGDENLGIHAKGEVDIGHAEAKVAGNIGWLDENGKFSPNAYVGAEAEAVAASASATVGVDLAGTKIDATGKVGFGVGAHAKIGIENGHFQADIGAYLGPGASIKLDVDISGTIDKVVEYKDEIVNTVSNVADAVGDTVSNVANAVGDTVNNVANAVGDTYNKAKNAVKSWLPW